MIVKKERSKSIVIAMTLWIAFFLPHTSIFGQFLHGILPILVLFLIGDFKSLGRNTMSLAITGIIFISFSVSVFSNIPVENKDVLRLFSLAALFLFFPFVGNVKIPNWALYVSVLFIFVSQVAYSWGIGSLVSFFDSFYPYDGQTESFKTDFLMSGAGEMDFILNRRYGGLYHNPNQAVRYVSVLFALFLIENRSKNLIQKLPFISLVLVSVALSGSRTGLLVTLILLLANSFILGSREIKLGSVISLSSIGLILVLIFYQIADLDLRIFDIAEGVESSLGMKIHWFSQVLDQIYSPLIFLFGHFTTASIEQYGIPLLDSEWGEAFYKFGLIGFILLSFFYLYLFRLKNSEIKFILLLLLWGISSTVLFSFRMSFIFMLVLSIYYSRFLQTSIK